MLDKIDNVVEIAFKARKDKKTFILSIGSLVAFGVAVGAIAVYESIAKELTEHNSLSPKESDKRDDESLF